MLDAESTRSRDAHAKLVSVDISKARLNIILPFLLLLSCLVSWNHPRGGDQPNHHRHCQYRHLLLLPTLSPLIAIMAEGESSQPTATPSGQPRPGRSPSASTAASPPNTGASGAKASPAPASASSAVPAPKGKSAKELKKEKRAALVAARGGEAGPSHGPGAGGADSASGPDAHAHAQGSSNGSSAAVSAPAGAGSAGGRPGMPHATSSFIPQPTPVRRPPILSSDSTLPAFTQAQQDLFFSHLPAHKSPNTREAFASGRVHPTVVRFGVMMASGTLRGANARTIGMMRAFQAVIGDYETPESAVMWKDLMSHLSPMITFLEGCRPKGQGGGNAIRSASPSSSWYPMNTADNVGGSRARSTGSARRVEGPN